MDKVNYLISLFCDKLLIDSNAPTILGVDNYQTTIRCGAQYLPVVTATAIDSCDGSVPVTITNTTVPCPGIWKKTWSALDSSGNSITKIHTYNVLPKCEGNGI